MAIQFNQCEVSINGNKMLAQSATISESNSLTPDYIFGNKVPVDLTPNNGFKANIQINYIVEPGNEYNYGLIGNINQPIFNSTLGPISIIIGGITGSGYLEQYSLKVSPNKIVEATVNYICFQELLGNFVPQPLSNLSQYDTLNLTGLAHYWSSQAVLSGNTATGSVISMDYNFKSNILPIYIIGNKIPVQVIYMDTQETFNITSEFLTHVLYTGQNASSAFNNYNTFNISNIGLLWNTTPVYTLKLNLMGGVVNTSVSEIKTDSLTLFTNSVNKYD